MKNNFEIKIHKAAFPNLSIGDLHGQDILLKGGLIGQKVRVKITRRKPGKLDGKILETLEASPLETEPGCPRADDCGGCRYQKLTYDHELSYKLETLRNLYADFDIDKNLLYLNESPIIEGYRNKMEYTFGDEFKDGPLVLGLHKRNRFYEIVDNFGCNIVPSDFESIRQESMFFFENENIAHYHKKTRQGALKFLIVRYAFATKEIMLNLVTKTDESISEELLQDYIALVTNLNLDGKVVSVFHTISDSLADAVVPDTITKLYGQDYITEKMNGLTFRISPFSFFQPNPIGAEKLFEAALAYAGDLEDKLVYDLYCGTGTISQIFAQKARKVIGVEIVEEAVEKAKENAKLNGLDNCHFIANDVLDEIANLSEKPDVLVLDPPRDGIHPKAIDPIISMGAETVVYISCNPRTQARDLHIFVSAGYKIEKLEFFDQFPRTAGAETVALLTRSSK